MNENIIINRKNGDPVKVYAETFEQEAYDQIKKLANYPAYSESKIRIMPDAHAGKGCTVGTTMTLTDKVTPNLVGVDIGCGMLAVHLDPSCEIDFKKLDETIRRCIPSGFEIRSKYDLWFTKFDKLNNLLCGNQVDLYRTICSIGTLGGGNHFIELDKAEDGTYWLVIHSGSRNLGVQVCKFYQELAFKRLSEKTSIRKKIREEVIARCKAEGRQRDIPTELDKALKSIQNPPVDKELAHLEGDDFKNYLYDMGIVQEYASLNRETMARVILKKMNWKETERFETIHNYIDIKNKILRKGSVSAQLGEKLLIPMNMRDGSLICIGKGNEDWNFSAPHGAGRLMSRSKAKELVDMDRYIESMEGIYTTSVSRATIDESPMVYKNMDEIMRCITPTVDIVEVIKPVYNFKAGEE